MKKMPTRQTPLNSVWNMLSFRVVVLILGCLRLTEAATNTLNHGDKLNSNSSDYLASRNGAVTLGFFKQEYGQTWDDKQFGYYLAMWYTEDKSNCSIWLANRDDPIADDSGVPTVDDTRLKIICSGGNPIRLFSLQSTSITINSSDTKLVLQDSGNLVLQGTNKVLWQSFDYPTDTFLAGMKLGVSHGARL
ncbi:S-locus-specific glycoprotein S13-like [Hibiscus syriacus]|uniref:S-locus-specific glycoprotein S13-like n=1 Tax=Hibiscus syriacus TaxID=106335 RepID=UPI001922F59C|nr:S-locus-specific glycoprotein S13-like [Hibiscus syriacus]